MGFHTASGNNLLFNNSLQPLLSMLELTVLGMDPFKCILYIYMDLYIIKIMVVKSVKSTKIDGYP